MFKNNWQSINENGNLSHLFFLAKLKVSTDNFAKNSRKIIFSHLFVWPLVVGYWTIPHQYQNAKTCNVKMFVYISQPKVGYIYVFSLLTLFSERALCCQCGWRTWGTCGQCSRRPSPPPATASPSTTSSPGTSGTGDQQSDSHGHCSALATLSVCYLNDRKWFCFWP